MLLYYSNPGAQPIAPVAIWLPKKFGQGAIEIGNEVRRLLLKLDIALVIVGIHGCARRLEKIVQPRNRKVCEAIYGEPVHGWSSMRDY